MQTIAIIDYGMGNLRSVAKALEQVAQPEQKVVITSDNNIIAKADRIIFPGQGAGKACMQALQTQGLDETIKQACKSKPVLGICMGLQVLMSHTQENEGVDCLSVFEGEVKAFKSVFDENDVDFKIPHMGWNQLKQAKKHSLWDGIKDLSYFYFVHSYYVSVKQPSIVAGTTNYGIDYVSAIADENVFAVQFHPEKSADNGLQLLSNFLKWSV